MTVKKLLSHQDKQVLNYNSPVLAERKKFNQIKEIQFAFPHESYLLLLTCHNPFFANFSITDCHTSLENPVVKIRSKQGKKLCKTMGSPERKFQSLEILTWGKSRTSRKRSSN